MINLTPKTENLNKHIPSELRAVINIFSADGELRAKALPFVNLKTKEIDWFRIGQNHFGSGHRTAIMWAKAIWSAQTSQNCDPFEHLWSMDLTIRKSVIDALAIAWGLA